MSPEDAIASLSGEPAKINPRTWMDEINRLRFNLGESMIAPLLGIDYNQAAERAASGQLLAEFPFTPSEQALHEIISARNTLQHATDLRAGESILEEGAIIPGRGRMKLLGWGDPGPTNPQAGVGFKKSATSFSRAQRYVGEPITFEVDANYVREPRPVQGLPGESKTAEGYVSLKSLGTFESETATEHPVPLKGIRRILINPKRGEEMHGASEAKRLIDRIKTLAEQHGITVIEGPKSELLKLRIRQP